MSLADLTDPSAVLSAIHEYDQLGRDAFLTKYGFGPARSYFLQHNGRLYDSKAIAGTALAFQPGVGHPLPAADFSGGEATVMRKLREGQQWVDQKHLRLSAEGHVLTVFGSSGQSGSTLYRVR